MTTTTTIDLGFSGTALANLDYTITAGVDAVVNSPGLPVQIVIPAGSTFGTITLTGAGLTLASNESVGVSVISVDGVAPAAPVNTNMTIGTTGFPVISIENLTVTEPGTSTAQVTIQLSGDAPSNMTVYYETAVDTAHPGTTPAIASAYTAVTSATPVTIPAGQDSVTVGIPVTGDPAAIGPETFLVELVGSPSQGVYAAAPNSTATVTLVESQPLISVENLTLIGGTAETAEVIVRLSEKVNGPVMVNYSTAADTVHPGTIPAASSGSNAAYTPISSGSITFVADQTEVTIPIPILASTLSEDETFLLNLSVASGSPGILVSNQTGQPVAGQATATVTLLASNPANVSPLQFQQANSLTNATVDTSASGPNSPADTSGAVGPDSLVVFDSNTYQVIDKFDGTVSQELTLNQFWNVALGADLPAGDTVFQPRVVYDPTSGRWYASALDEGIPAGSSGPLDASNNILLAVSLTSDPTQGWVGFTRAVGSTLNVADFDSLGFNSNSVVVTANIYTIQNGALTSTAVLSVPKANLISATTPNAASVTSAETYDSTLSDTPASYDAAVDYDTTVNEYLLAQLGTTGPELETVSGGGGPTASVTGPVAVAGIGGLVTGASSFPVAPPQPAGAPPLTTGPGIQTVPLTASETGSLTDSLSNDFSGTVALVNGDLWAAQTVAVGGADVIQWMEISVSGTPTVIQHGLITDVTGKGLNFYYPSLSVDSDGDVVIGFNGSSLTQQISSYAVYGTTTSGVTTFTSPSLLKQGTGIYAGLSDASPASAAITATIPNTTTPATTFTTTGTGDSIEITVQLAAAAPQGGSTVILGFNGTAVANNDYSISSNTNAVTGLLGAPIELVIPAGLTTGSVVLTGLDNTHATNDETVNVSIVSINGTAPATPQSTSLTLIDPSASVCFCREPGHRRQCKRHHGKHRRAAFRTGDHVRHGALHGRRRQRLGERLYGNDDRQRHVPAGANDRDDPGSPFRHGGDQRRRLFGHARHAQSRATGTESDGDGDAHQLVRQPD